MHVLNVCALESLVPPSDTNRAQLLRYAYGIYPSPLKREKVQNGSVFVRGLPARHPLGVLLAELARLCALHYLYVVCPQEQEDVQDDDPSDATFCGAGLTMPDYSASHGLGAAADMDVGRAVGLGVVASGSESGSTPLDNHDSVVDACVRALRSSWPSTDRACSEAQSCASRGSKRGRQGGDIIDAKRYKCATREFVTV